MTMTDEQVTRPDLRVVGHMEADDASTHLSQARTIELLLESSERPNRTVPIRRSFLQLSKPSGSKVPGTLQSLVANRQERALDLYLLVAAVTYKPDYEVTTWSSTWARSIGIFDEKTGAAAVSRAWKTLKNLGLISTARGKGRQTTVTKRLEDGSGDYTPPGKRNEPYLQLPFEYWDHDLHLNLSLPGKALYLIALANYMPPAKTRFPLVHTRIAQYYGLAEMTVANGIKELITHGVLAQKGVQRYETLAVRNGWATRPLYEICPPFSRRGPAPTPTVWAEDFSEL
ncbi:hypothetical protein ACWDUX_32270 [Streptomyces sp. NPDC003444]